MKSASCEHAGRRWRLGAVLAGLVLAGCAGKSVPMQSTQTTSPGGADAKVSAATDGKGGSGASGSQTSAAGGVSQAKEGSNAAVGGAGTAGADGAVGNAARASQGSSTGKGASASGDVADASNFGGEAAARPGAVSQASEDALTAERARQAEIEAAARARQAELEAAERERRGRVETAANQVLIGENEKLQTLDGMLPAVLNMDDKGQFDFDSYALSDAVKAQLDEIAARLAVAPYDRLHVVGFTDRIGPEDYNRKLSEKRAWSVAGYLMDKGVPPYKLKVEGKGETGSLVAEEECKGLKRDALIECLQRDRRVELVATVKEYNLKVQ